MEGEIVCPCGYHAFKTQCFGEFYHKNKMAICEYGNKKGKYGQAVRAVCAVCGTDYLLYDFALHSYDDLICKDGIAVPDEMLDDFITKTDTLFNIKISLKYDDDDED